ncbi:hypothetical protein ACTXGJ_09770 [Psychrobacter sp. 1Y11]|uniref:hypothetical protein n=1 Tax=Psychrobacter sp. 1Y11 TaxID=3457446 RepID=UPI003FD5B54B
MKKLLISATLALSSLTAISACANTNARNTMPHNNMQQIHHNNSGQHMRNSMNTMMAELDLTAQQKAQIQAFKQNKRGDHMQTREAMMNILTPEQRQKLATMRAQHMKQGGHMMKRGHMNQEGHMMNKGHMNQNSHMNQ